MIKTNLKYEIVTLCGSTKFKEDYRVLERKLVMNGFLAFSCGFFAHSEDKPITKLDKEIADKVHLMKIAHSNFVICINRGNYIGDSTQREIDHAFQLKKRIYFYDSKRHNLNLFIRDLLVDRGYLY